MSQPNCHSSLQYPCSTANGIGVYGEPLGKSDGSAQGRQHLGCHCRRVALEHSHRIITAESHRIEDLASAADCCNRFSVAVRLADEVLVILD